MPHPHLDWRAGAKDSRAVANVRVCLALMRVYRRVLLPHDEAELSSVVRCLWPVIRLFPSLFCTAMLSPAVRAHAPRTIRVPHEDLEERAHKAIQELVERRSLAAEPSDDWVLELLGDMLVNHTPAFGTLFDAVERKLEALVAASRAPFDKRLDLLARLLSLSDEETAYLRLCAATSECSFTGNLFAIARPPARMVQAIQQAIGAPREHEVRAMLSEGSRLSRSGLLEVNPYGHRNDMEDCLRLSGQALRILGSPTSDIEGMASLVLQPSIEATKEVLEWPHLEAKAALLRTLLSRSLPLGTAGINILLYGEPGTGKTQFAARLVSSISARAFSVADMVGTGAGATRSERLSSLMLTQLFAPVGRSVVLLDEAEDIFQDDYNSPTGRTFGKREERKSWMNHLLEENKHPVIWMSNRIDHIDPAYLRRFTYCLEFPRTPRKVRRVIAQAHLEPVGCSGSLIDSIASEPHVSPALLASAARFGQIAALSRKGADHAVKLMLHDMVKAIGGKLQASVPERSTRFDLVYLNVKGAVTPAELMSGVCRQGRGRILLSGPPGTGKTQFAAEIASQLGRELIYKTASDINSMWYGESERNVARMFDDCDAATEVLFLDEADTLMRARDSSGHRADVAVTAEFLRQVEAFKGVFVCATNFQSHLDAALLRRFEFRVEMLPLSSRQRTALFCEAALGWDRLSGRNQPTLDSSVQRRLDALEQLTAGDVANVVRRVRSLQLQFDAAAWVTELEAEHRAKPGSGRATIGFV